MPDDVLRTDTGSSPVAGPPRARPAATTRKILVVNDHVEVRGVITEFLRRRGLIAVPVRDAESAAVVCERVVVDLILLHLVVLDVAETALIRQVKLQRPSPRLIVISAVTSPDLERECRVLGVDGVMTKPIVLVRLERAIARLLRASEVPRTQA
jgi:DNA-binding response OmpR family regulator